MRFAHTGLRVEPVGVGMELSGRAIGLHCMCEAGGGKKIWRKYRILPSHNQARL